jgi:hypothetical protein
MRERLRVEIETRFHPDPSPSLITGALIHPPAGASEVGIPALK